MRSEKVLAHGIFKVKGECYFESEKSFWEENQLQG